MVLGVALLNTQHYKVQIKGKAEQSMERSSYSPLHLGVVAIEREAFRSLSTKVANLLTYKENLVLNNLQWLICHKTKLNPIYLISMYKEDLALNKLQWLIYYQTAQRLECLPMSRETWVQSRSSHTKDFKNGTWYHLAQHSAL